MPVSAPSLSITNANALISALSVNVGQTQLQSLTVTTLTASGASSLQSLNATTASFSGAISFSSGSYTTSISGSSSATSSVGYTLPPSDGSYGQVLSTNGNGGLLWITAGTAGPTTATYVKTLNVQGLLSFMTGNARWYPDTSVTLTQAYATVSVPPSSGSAQFVVKKNGVSISTVSISSGQYKSSLVSLSANLLATDYVTIDVVSGNGASDAAISILYTR